MGLACGSAASLRERLCATSSPPILPLLTNHESGSTRCTSYATTAGGCEIRGAVYDLERCSGLGSPTAQRGSPTSPRRRFTHSARVTRSTLADRLEAARDRLRLPSLPRHIVHNAGWLLVDRVLRLALGVVVGIWIARYLGPARFGLLNYAVAFAGAFGALATLGLDAVVVRASWCNIRRTATHCSGPPSR